MSKVVEKLIVGFEAAAAPAEMGEKLKVNAVISKAAFIYEKIRNAIDYQEEHLERKSAIYRIMRRKLLLERVIMENYLLEKYHHENIAEQLLLELIRGGYVRQDVSVKTVEVVDKIIQKYNLLFAKIREFEGRLKRRAFRYWLEIAAVEIENAVLPSIKEKAMANTMFSVYSPRIEIEQEMDEKEKELQIYLACHRVLYKWDEAMMRYLLLTLYYPEWNKAGEEMIAKIAGRIGKVATELEKQINHPRQKQIFYLLKKKAIVFWVLQDVLSENLKRAAAVFNNQEALEAEVKKAIMKRYKGVRAKLRRGVVRSIIYVFFTKMVLALALEFPMDYYLSGAVNFTSGAINIIFPPVLMFLVAILIRMPKKENMEKILEEVKAIALQGGLTKTFKLKPPLGRGLIMRFMFNLIYSLTFIFSLMVIFWGLNNIEFNFFSSLIFVLFLTLVSFFGLRIRRPVQDLLTIERRESIIGSTVDFVALPFVSMGRWMSGKFSKINVFAYFLDLIIEAPFKLLIEIFEDLFGFIREKKEDVLSE